LIFLSHWINPDEKIVAECISASNPENEENKNPNFCNKDKKDQIFLMLMCVTIMGCV
jgi:hypothetical protein